MEEMLVRLYDNLTMRVGGPMTFRLLLQPLMACIIGLRSGLRDGREGRAPYFWSIITNPEERKRLLHEGWKDILRVLILAVVIDLVYQLIVLRWFYPLEALVVAVTVAIVPYLVVRGLTNRLTQAVRKPRHP